MPSEEKENHINGLYGKLAYLVRSLPDEEEFLAALAEDLLELHDSANGYCRSCVEPDEAGDLVPAGFPCATLETLEVHVLRVLFPEDSVEEDEGPSGSYDANLEFAGFLESVFSSMNADSAAPDEE